MILSWLLPAFLLCASYSGVLRASLIRPEYTRPVETIHDIVASGKPWKMVLYGSSPETSLQEQTEEPFVTFWRDKEVVPYQEFPYETVRTGQISYTDTIYVVTTYKGTKKGTHLLARWDFGPFSSRANIECLIWKKMPLNET